MQIIPTKPFVIALFTTLRCYSACDNCCFGCNPKQGRSMTYKEMKSYVDKCLKAYPDTITHLDLTGGECMLLGKDIDRIFSYAKGKGLTCGMVSNAFWATDYKKAYRTLERLQRKGLSIASFSTGEDHDKYVPWMNVLNACVASATLGIDTTLRIEFHSKSTSVLDYMVADFRLADLVNQKKLKIVFDGWTSIIRVTSLSQRKPRIKCPQSQCPAIRCLNQ